MRAVVQRVNSARVIVDTRVTGEIGRGLLVFVGVEKGDTHGDIEYLVNKVRELRIFEDDGGADGRKRMNRSVADVGGSVLVVSQFTPEIARDYYETVVRELRQSGVTVATGEFQAMMRVQLENDGPVTILIDSRRRF
jgi:D-tyrosyl-tRNA(Tyr) deacylase